MFVIILVGFGCCLCRWGGCGEREPWTRRAARPWRSSFALRWTVIRIRMNLRQSSVKAFNGNHSSFLFFSFLFFFFLTLAFLSFSLFKFWIFGLFWRFSLPLLCGLFVVVFSNSLIDWFNLRLLIKLHRWQLLNGLQCELMILRWGGRRGRSRQTGGRIGGGVFTLSYLAKAAFYLRFYRTCNIWIKY